MRSFIYLGFVLSIGLGCSKSTFSDEISPLGRPFFIIDDAVKYEGDDVNAAIIKVKLSYASAFPVSLKFNTVPGYLASADTDFVHKTGTIFFEPGTTDQSFSIDIIGDTIAEDDETFRILLFSPLNAASAKHSIEVLIVDDDL